MTLKSVFISRSTYYTIWNPLAGWETTNTGKMSLSLKNGLDVSLSFAFLSSFPLPFSHRYHIFLDARIPQVIFAQHMKTFDEFSNFLFLPPHQLILQASTYSHSIAVDFPFSVCPLSSFSQDTMLPFSRHGDGGQ